MVRLAGGVQALVLGIRGAPPFERDGSGIIAAVMGEFYWVARQGA
ncbi:hypothetical protein P4U43_13120 [Arthrobacter sp. EH-1B-1]|uniref:Uncharacterized protein n=1 Tax=Arthrobacter vasquezii TaxID=2977629 RepID=A0ABT6CXZ7_9MICC|nr:hypothetical protein [Arthrobacter vasquezii]MDF9278728.1 hypothetical protein [Arthrobacter vasquezii]